MHIKRISERRALKRDQRAAELLDDDIAQPFEYDVSPTKQRIVNMLPVNTTPNAADSRAVKPRNLSRNVEAEETITENQAPLSPVFDSAQNQQTAMTNESSEPQIVLLNDEISLRQFWTSLLPLEHTLTVGDNATTICLVYCKSVGLVPKRDDHLLRLLVQLLSSCSTEVLFNDLQRFSRFLADKNVPLTKMVNVQCVKTGAWALDRDSYTVDELCALFDPDTTSLL